MWQGQNTILRIERYERKGEVVSFDYSLLLGGDNHLIGKGSLNAVTCEAVLSNFDSAGRIVSSGGQWGFESVDPAWRLMNGGNAGKLQ